MRKKKQKRKQRQKRRQAAGATDSVKNSRGLFPLRKLVAGINSKNRHELVDFGPAVGKERLSGWFESGTEKKAPLERVLYEAGRKAKSRRLTAGKLDSLLKGT